MFASIILASAITMHHPVSGLQDSPAFYRTSTNIERASKYLPVFDDCELQAYTKSGIRDLIAGLEAGVMNIDQFKIEFQSPVLEGERSVKGAQLENLGDNYLPAE